MKNLKNIITITLSCIYNFAISQGNINATFTNFTQIDGPVNDIVIDAHQTKWLGTNNGLIEFFDTINSEYTTLNSNLPNDTINVLAIEENGDKWIGTNYGLAKLSGDFITVYNTLNSDLPNNTINAIEIGENGDIWFGTEGGLARLTSTEFTVYTTENSELPNNQVNALAIDKAGYLWIGTFGGFASFHNEAFNVYYSDLMNLYLTDINVAIVDENDEKWIGAITGFAIASYVNFEIFTKQQTDLPSNNVWDITEESKVGKWIGTDSGLSLFADRTFYNLNTHNSDLPHNNVNTVAVDRNGNKWVGTNRGFSKLETCFLPSTPNFIDGDSVVCAGIPNSYTIDAVPDATSYVWELPNGVEGESSTKEILLNFTTGSKSEIVTVRAMNNCGLGESISKRVKVLDSVTPTIKVKWDNVLICPNTNNYFQQYQWFNNGIAIDSATKQYYVLNSEEGDLTVKATDSIGCIAESEPFTFNALKSPKIFPNPTQGDLTVILRNDLQGLVYVNVYNQTGLKVISESYERTSTEQEFCLQTKNLTQGIYELEILQDNYRYSENVMVSE